MSKLKDLQEKREKLADEIRVLADKFNAAGNVWQGEDEATWDKVNAAYDANQLELDAENKAIAEAAERSTAVQARVEKIAAENTDKRPIGRDGANLHEGPVHRDYFLRGQVEDQLGYRGDNLVTALQGWLMHGSELVVNLTNKHQLAAAAVHQSLNSPVFSIALNRDWHDTRMRMSQFRNALSGESGVAGGYTKDETMIMNLELAMLAYGGMFQVAEIIRTAQGEPMRWPTASDTSNTGRQVGENASHDSGTDPTFGEVVWNAYTFTSDIVKVPNELMTDSVFNLATILGAMLGERLGRIQNTKYTTGTGSSTPYGIVTRATAGVTSAGSTSIAFDELIELEHSLDPSRRAMPGVGYMFHDSILKALRKLKDGEGRYLWQSGANSGAPSTLNTYPYTINQDMASSIATTNVTILFGQLTQYKIRQVGSIVLRRLDERFADNNQTGFLAIMRGDGNLLDAGDGPVRKLTQV